MEARTLQRPLQAILFAGEASRKRILSTHQRTTICKGWLDYLPGPVLLGCHILNWACMREITSVQYCYSRDVLLEDIVNAGYPSRRAYYEAMSEIYPGFDGDTAVTVIKWC